MREKDKKAKLNPIEIYTAKLVELVSEACGISAEEIFARGNNLQCVHARWFYWYALRYITGESYEAISKSPLPNSHKYAGACVGFGIKRIGEMMAQEPLWHKRWAMLKQAIKENIPNAEIIEDNTIVISIPKGMRSHFNVVIQEKK